MTTSIRNVLFGTFTLRFSTGLTGGLLVFYLGNLRDHGGPEVTAIAFSFLYATFYLTELLASPFFGLLSDRLGHHRVMQYGPLFGLVAVIITGLTTNLYLLGGTRVLEGLATAASVPSILGFLAMASTSDEGLRGKVSSRFELATLAGIGAGTLAAALLYDNLGTLAFFLNAFIYAGSYAIYRFGVAAPDSPARPAPRPRVRLATLSAADAELPHLAAGADLDRDQRGPRRICRAGPLQPRPRAAAALRQPAAGGRPVRRRAVRRHGSPRGSCSSSA